MNRIYSMSREEYQGLCKVASEQVPFGIYAVEKKNMQSCDVTIVAAGHN